MRILSLWLLLLWFGVLHAGDDLAAFQAVVAKRLKGDYTGYATPFTGIYSLTWPDEKEIKTPVMADQNLTMLANSFRENWSYFAKGHPPVEKEKVQAIRARAAAELPLHSAIAVRFGDGPFSMAVYSAVDCGFCRRLEALLARHKINYYVFPGSLSPENFAVSKSIWCNPDPAAAWVAVMQQQSAIPPVASCPGYPISDIRYTGALFSYGNTPGVIFADGDVIARLPEGPAEEAEFLQIVKDKIARGLVFDR